MRFAAWLLALAAVAAAEEPLKLETLAAEVLRVNPEVLAAQKKYEAARQRPAQERSLPDPMVSVGWNASGNPLPGAGLGTEPTANIGAMVSQEVPYPGKLRLKGLISTNEAGAEAQLYRATQLSVLSRLKQAYFRLHHAESMLEVLGRNRTALDSLLRVTEARYSVGKAPQADVFRAQTQLTMIEARMTQVRRDRRAREAEINALLNRSANTAVGVPEEPHIMPVTFTEDQLLAKATQGAPMLVRDQKMMERARNALSLAKREYYPDVTLNGGYYSMGAMPSMYMFRADVKVPLRLGRLRAGVAERSQEVVEARYTYEATARSIESRVREDYASLKTAEQLLDLYAKVAMPQAKLTVESTLASYQSGGIDFTAVMAAEVAAFEYEMDYHEQMQEFHLALARLEELTGVELIR